MLRQLMPSRWPWRRWRPRASFFTTPTGEGNDFGESFFGRGQPVTAARIRLPRRSLDGDVCRSQSSLTFSARKKPPADKSQAHPAPAPVASVHGVVWGYRTDGEASLLLPGTESA